MMQPSLPVLHKDLNIDEATQATQATNVLKKKQFAC